MVVVVVVSASDETQIHDDGRRDTSRRMGR
jgi:hypothetical protein